jgi:hypothetical protein
MLWGEYPARIAWDDNSWLKDFYSCSAKVGAPLLLDFGSLISTLFDWEITWGSCRREQNKFYL